MGWVGMGVCVCERERERFSKSLRLLMKIRSPRPPLNPLNQNLEDRTGDLFLDISQVDDLGLGTTKQYCRLFKP